MPIWLAASPTPGAAYIVAIMSSASRASAPSNSVTSGQRCFSPRSPKTRMGKVAMGRETTDRRRWAFTCDGRMSHTNAGAVSDPQRIHLRPQAPHGPADGERPCQGIGQTLGRGGPDEDSIVGASRDADATAGGPKGVGGGGERRGVARQAGQGGVRREVEELSARPFGLGQDAGVGPDG